MVKLISQGVGLVYCSCHWQPLSSDLTLFPSTFHCRQPMYSSLLCYSHCICPGSQLEVLRDESQLSKSPQMLHSVIFTTLDDCLVNEDLCCQLCNSSFSLHRQAGQQLQLQLSVASSLIDLVVSSNQKSSIACRSVRKG